MPLPDLIEIVPLDQPVRAEITVPGSKSITNRALVLAALAEGETTLKGALWSEDTQVMVECLQDLGFMVNVAPDPDEPCNRTITVYGQGGKVPRGGTVEQPLELFVGNAGTAARFLSAMVCLGSGVYRLHGVPRMHERPQAALFGALRELGYRVDSPNDKLPALVYGGGPRPGAMCNVSIEESSQFASALLLSEKAGAWSLTVTGENAEESPYVEMTKELVKAFPPSGGFFLVEPDASSGSYFLAAAGFEFGERRETHSADGMVHTCTARGEMTVTVRNWPTSGWQIDANFPRYVALVNLGSFLTPQQVEESDRGLRELWGPNWRERAEQDYQRYLEEFHAKHGIPSISRQRDLGDSIMTVIVLAPRGFDRVQFTDLGRLRVQESERVVALRTELTKCGAKVVEEGDALTVFPSQLHGAEIETCHDHRMAMSFAILGLKVPGIKIKNPACVKKTFPNFFQKLAAPPPGGLGATILDAATGRRLSGGELFAD
jgi:3-phosphoshikimate 1-carboxyvinyltransferase